MSKRQNDEMEKNWQKKTSVVQKIMCIDRSDNLGDTKTFTKSRNQTVRQQQKEKIEKSRAKQI